METIIIIVFIVGYLAITMEHNLKIDKLIPALAMMAILWAVIALAHMDVFEVNTALKELEPTHIDEILLHHFWSIHDPTYLNRQGNDIGTQCRSVIFYTNESQKEIIQSSLEKQNNLTIVTEVLPLEKFYPAEDYHQNYYKNNSTQPYCAFVISPKIKKFEDSLKNN